MIANNVYDTKKIQLDFDQLQCCVIVPTYNNSSFLSDILTRIQRFTNNIIVVDDGSTDNTALILGDFKDLNIISFTKNRGKGYALRKGFKHALQKGYSYAITIDSDGQHQPEDIPLFIDKIKKCPGSIIIGARNMSQDSIPKKSSFGHKFSNFWFRVETGIPLPDTQSGYRLYPLKSLNKMRFITTKYEFEIEILVRAAWRGVNITSIPVEVKYFNKEERISHFRPFVDFSRVSLLNIVLVAMAIVYYWPLSFMRSLSWEKIKGLVKNDIMMSRDSNLKLSLSVFLGIFMGIAPVWGWQLIIAIFLAILFKLNKIIVIATANISIPPMIPLILYISYITGGIVLGKDISLHFYEGITFEIIKNDIIQYVVGAMVFGFIFAILASLTTFLLLTLFRKKKFKSV